MEKRAFVFAKDELVHVNVFGPDNFDEEVHGGESWGNVVVQALDDAATELKYSTGIVVPDYDGATSGETDAINILLPTEVLHYAQEALENCGISFGDPMAPKPTHYGDGAWLGAELLVFKRDWEDEYWLLVLN